MFLTSEILARNGVDTTALFATLDALRALKAVKDAMPANADEETTTLQFRASNSWVGGTRNRSTIERFYGADQEMQHTAVHVVDADHPAAPIGGSQDPTPVDYLLHALASSLTAGVANIAAARDVNLTEITSMVEGDIDLLGILGLGEGARNGFQNITVRYSLKGDDPAKLRQVVEQSRARSAVFDVLTDGVPVAIEVDAG